MSFEQANDSIFAIQVVHFLAVPYLIAPTAYTISSPFRPCSSVAGSDSRAHGQQRRHQRICHAVQHSKYSSRKSPLQTLTSPPIRSYYASFLVSHPLNPFRLISASASSSFSSVSFATLYFLACICVLILVRDPVRNFGGGVSISSLRSADGRISLAILPIFLALSLTSR